MTIAIPTGLKPVVSGYQLDEPGGVLRTEVAGGASRYALDWDRGPQRFSVTLILTALQFTMWTVFYHHSIKKGALAFEMQLDSGFGVATHSVNILPGSYSASRTEGVMWAVGFVVESEGQVNSLSAEEAAALLALYEEVGIMSSELLARIALFANYDTLVLDF